MGILNFKGASLAQDANGQPVPFAEMFVYGAGKSTLSPVFEDEGLTIMKANPIIADALGRFDTSYLVEGAYRVVIRAASGEAALSEHDVVVETSTNNGSLYSFSSVADLESDETLFYSSAASQFRAVPTRIIGVCNGGFSYRIAAEDAADHDLTTAGGVKLYDLKKRSPQAAGSAATNPDGKIVEMDGLQYQVDQNATGAASATQDIGIDGLKPFGKVRAAHFGGDLQRAIHNSGSGEIHLSDETLTIDSLILNRDIRIIGQGRRKSKLIVTGHTTYDGVKAGIVASGNDAAGLASQMRINGVEIDVQTAEAGVVGVLVMRKLHMDEVFVHGAPLDGINFRSGNPNLQAPYFCEFTGVWSKGNGRMGLRLTENCNANRFVNCQFDGNAEHGVHQTVLGLSGVNQAVYNNIFQGGQASYNQMHGFYFQNGSECFINGTYAEYNSQIDGGNPKVGVYKNLKLSSGFARGQFHMGSLGTSTNPEQTLGLNTVTSNMVSVGGHVLTPASGLELGYANVGTGRKVDFHGAGGASHAINFHEGNSIIARLIYDGGPSSPNNEVRMEVTSNNGANWSVLWQGRNNGNLGFFNKSPVPQQSIAGPAVDAASTQALTNSLRSALLNLGLVT
ncbi:hypothetical protein [Tropicibacter oceani]|uniref:Right handed beta helix domain-containing protein n=1 Tax=Tropicibacter oceani TaxID=3058420 RepID=A0ABY8QKE5_9RHOB|nr:hypothetical protein [Tropicibacter oceani]WGW04478.1 hypothetical protein QF118_02715 [Tropicibacter oceani]